MKASQELQDSGIQWREPAPMMLSRGFQGPPPGPRSTHGAAIFDDLERQMSNFTVQHATVLKEVRRNFVLPVDSSVVTFLTEHRTIPQILLEATPQLEACFGRDAIFVLRAPIDDSGSRTLYAVILWPGKVQDVRDALNKFDNDWWIAQSRRASGYLTFTYELV